MNYLATFGHLLGSAGFGIGLYSGIKAYVKAKYHIPVKEGMVKKLEGRSEKLETMYAITADKGRENPESTFTMSANGISLVSYNKEGFTHGIYSGQIMPKKKRLMFALQEWYNNKTTTEKIRTVSTIALGIDSILIPLFTGGKTLREIVGVPGDYDSITERVISIGEQVISGYGTFQEYRDNRKKAAEFTSRIIDFDRRLREEPNFENIIEEKIKEISEMMSAKGYKNF